MAYESDMLKEFTFFTRATDEQLALYKLSKIGIKRTDLTVRTMPPAALRKEYVVEVENEKFIHCINCDHMKVSHKKSTGVVDFSLDVCYGLTEGENCKCKKFIDVEGKTLDEVSDS